MIHAMGTFLMPAEASTTQALLRKARDTYETDPTSPLPALGCAYAAVFVGTTFDTICLIGKAAYRISPFSTLETKEDLEANCVVRAFIHIKWSCSTLSQSVQTVAFALLFGTAYLTVATFESIFCDRVTIYKAAIDKNDWATDSHDPVEHYKAKFEAEQKKREATEETLETTQAAYAHVKKDYEALEKQLPATEPTEELSQAPKSHSKAIQSEVTGKEATNDFEDNEDYNDSPIAPSPKKETQTTTPGDEKSEKVSSRQAQLDAAIKQRDTTTYPSSEDKTIVDYLTRELDAQHTNREKKENLLSQLVEFDSPASPISQNTDYKTAAANGQLNVKRIRIIADSGNYLEQVLGKIADEEGQQNSKTDPAVLKVAKETVEGVHGKAKALITIFNDNKIHDLKNPQKLQKEVTYLGNTITLKEALIHTETVLTSLNTTVKYLNKIECFESIPLPVVGTAKRQLSFDPVSTLPGSKTVVGKNSSKLQQPEIKKLEESKDASKIPASEQETDPKPRTEPITNSASAEDQDKNSPDGLQSLNLSQGQTSSAESGFEEPTVPPSAISGKKEGLLSQLVDFDSPASPIGQNTDYKTAAANGQLNMKRICIIADSGNYLDQVLGKIADEEGQENSKTDPAVLKVAKETVEGVHGKAKALITIFNDNKIRDLTSRSKLKKPVTYLDNTIKLKEALIHTEAVLTSLNDTVKYLNRIECLQSIPLPVVGTAKRQLSFDPVSTRPSSKTDASKASGKEEEQSNSPEQQSGVTLPAQTLAQPSAPQKSSNPVVTVNKLGRKSLQ